MTFQDSLGEDQSGKLQFSFRTLVDPARWIAPLTREFFVFQNGMVFPDKNFKAEFAQGQSFCLIVAKKTIVDVGGSLTPSKAVSNEKAFTYVEYADQGRQYIPSGKPYLTAEISQKGDKLFDKVTCYKNKETKGTTMTAYDLAAALGPYAKVESR